MSIKEEGRRGKALKDAGWKGRKKRVDSHGRACHGMVGVPRESGP
jgi:hypothetical protein